MDYWKEFIKTMLLGVAIFAILYLYIFVFA
jgi:hypothetical protein